MGSVRGSGACCQGHVLKAREGPSTADRHVPDTCRTYPTCMLNFQYEHIAYMPEIAIRMRWDDLEGRLGQVACI